MDDFLGQEAPPPETQYQLPVKDLNTDFERKFPPDALGEEMNANSRVWKVFHDESMSHDTVMLDGWNKTLDILLIFAGLFSAVDTAFIIESYKLLQPDNGAYTASALHALVLASNNNRTSLPDPPDINGSPSTLSLWVNALWFTSLTLSLGVALLSILAKQWLGEYATRMAASASDLKDWTKRRMFFFQGITSWHLSTFIALLPSILHIALFLFWAGLACFLYTLNFALGIWITLLGGVLLAFWLSCLIAPLWHPDCPSATPLVYYLRGAVIQFLAICMSRRPLLPIINPISPVVPSGPPGVSQRIDVVRFRHRVFTVLTAGYRVTGLYLAHVRHPHKLWHTTRQILASKYTAVNNWVGLTKSTILHEAATASFYDPSRMIWPGSEETKIDAAAIRWLALSVSNSDANRVALQALGALDPHSRLADVLRQDTELIWALKDAINERSLHPLDTTRLARSLLCVAEEVDFNTTLIIQKVLASQQYPDLALLRAWAARDRTYILEHAPLWSSAPTPSLSSTAGMLLRHRMPFQLIPALLLCVNFNEMDSGSWNSICAVLSGEECSLNRYGHRGRLCVIDGLARGLVRKRWNNPQCAILLLPRLLNSVGPSIRMTAGDMPSLVAYIASDLFQKQMSSEHVALSRTMDLFSGVRWDSGIVSPDVLTRALWNLVQTSLHPDDIDREVNKGLVRSAAYLVSSLIDYGFDFVSDHDWRVVSGENLTMSLNFILRFRNDRRGMTFWEMLHTPFDQLLVTPIRKVATALCCARHQDLLGGSVLIEAFFAAPQMRSLLQILPDHDHESLYLYSDTPKWDEIIKMLQHCIALHPSFWHDFSNSAKETQEVERVARLARGLLGLGPCRTCTYSSQANEWAEDILRELETSALNLSVLEDIRLLFDEGHLDSEDAAEMLYSSKNYIHYASLDD